MIPVIDRRTGDTVAPGETMIHPTNPGPSHKLIFDLRDVAVLERIKGTSWWKLVAVADWLFRARVTVHTTEGVRHLWLPVTTRRTPFGRQRVVVYPS